MRLPIIRNLVSIHGDCMRIMEDFAHNVLFAIWLLESNPSVILTPKQKEVNKYLRRGMREMLVLEE